MCGENIQKYFYKKRNLTQKIPFWVNEILLIFIRLYVVYL